MTIEKKENVRFELLNIVHQQTNYSTTTLNKQQKYHISLRFIKILLRLITVTQLDADKFVKLIIKQYY